jgi:translation initiation factor IF-2
VKKLKVKDLADRFGVSAKDIMRELASEGMDLKSSGSIIPDDMVELVEMHLTDILKNKGGKKRTAEEKAADEAAEKAAAGDAAAAEVHLKSPIIVKSLADALGKKPNEIITSLMSMNILASINQAIPQEAAAKVCQSFGRTLVVDKREKEEHLKHSVPQHPAGEPEAPPEDKPEDMRKRPPVITFLGHVDHGKTSLQDKIRKTNVAGGEDGGITQHIGASVIEHKGSKIVFIDTPGHEAFTAMRARGAEVTDIAVLVVAADDGFMPQTVEALNHARAAKVPVIVAMNKMDLPGANPERIFLQMQQNGLMCEEWGGETGTVRVSAKTGDGIDKLLERIVLESEMLEIKANYKKPGEAVVLEAQLEQGFGPTANILVKGGVIKVGDVVLCGKYFGKVKALIDSRGKNVREAEPGTPVKIAGLSGIPDAGSKLIVCASEKDAREIAEQRGDQSRADSLVRETGATFEDVFSQFTEGKSAKLRLLIKSDVKGSGEAIVESLKKIPSDKIKTDVLSCGVGAITENDVLLASASKAMIVGFHVRVNPGVNTLAKKEGVEIRLYSIIYELVEDITEALEGRLAPEKREKDLGTARIIKIFEMSKGPRVCGCAVDKGSIRVGAKARVLRNSEIIYNGEIRSLRRFQDDVREVKQGFECGIRLDNFTDFTENDVIRCYEIEMKKATLQ